VEASSWRCRSEAFVAETECRDLHRVADRELEHALAELAEPAEDGAGLALAHRPQRRAALVRPTTAAIVAPAQHHLRRRALPGGDADTQLALELECRDHRALAVAVERRADSH